MKAYYRVPIIECEEPLEPIPLDLFAVERPHPYERLSAPYGDASPYYLRRSVVKQLIYAQELLQHDRGQWRIQVFDAYRPIAVQKFMVEHTFHELLQTRNLTVEQLTDAERQEIFDEVYQFWALPSTDPLKPPPHSTGAAVDVTLVDADGVPVDMGSPIDELSPRSFPDYFISEQAILDGVHEGDRLRCHQNRQLLNQVMLEAGFRRHPQEWWHFSSGDQLWAWIVNRETLETLLVAKYGAV